MPHFARPRALTLVELLVSITIFVLLALMLMTFVQLTVRSWSRAERARVLNERGSRALDRMAEDLSLACGQDPDGVDTVRALFIGDADPNTGAPRLLFVRSFETGPERALTLNAGDGRPTELRFRTPAEQAEDEARAKVAAPQAPDRDLFTGTKLGDYRALGGMAQVAWFVKDRVLYRSIRAPVGDKFLDLLDASLATAVTEDVLFFDLEYWSQRTQSWELPATRTAPRGPELIWDSSRGIAQGVLAKFFLHRGPASRHDPFDDVFPQKVRITLTVDSPMPRCVHTKLTEALGGGDGRVFVDSVQGFPGGGDGDGYILVDNEWIRYGQKTDDEFIVQQRGARGTVAADHAEGAVVRAGRTFTRVVFLPNFREDFSTEEEFQRRNRKGPRP